MEEIAEAAVGEARRRCPVRTGRLRRSLRIFRNLASFRIGSRVRYALFAQRHQERTLGPGRAYLDLTSFIRRLI